MDGESIRVTRSVVLPLAEVELRFSRSSGPGGQHAQKSETRVEAVFDVEVLGRADRRARSGASSRARGRCCARSRRTSAASCGTASSPSSGSSTQLRRALKVERRRVPTKPGKGAVEKRLEQKRRRSQTKRLRQRPVD